MAIGTFCFFYISNSFCYTINSIFNVFNRYPLNPFFNFLNEFFPSGKLNTIAWVQIWRIRRPIGASYELIKVSYYFWNACLTNMRQNKFAHFNQD